MTRKDYQLIARTIKESLEINQHSWKTNESTDSQIAIMALAQTLAIRLKDENPLFNHEIFAKACGIPTRYL